MTSQPSLFLLLSLLLFGSTFTWGATDDARPRSIDGLWTGENTNNPYGLFLTIRLTTNGYGALYGGGGSMGFPGTFTYTLSDGQVRYVTNGTPFLTGTLRYDAAADVLIYQERADLVKKYKQSPTPLVLRRETNEIRRAMLDSMVGATGHSGMMSALRQYMGTLTNASEAATTIAREENSAQPDAAPEPPPRAASSEAHD